VVGNKLLEWFLTDRGYLVCNLGVCTPAQEIAEMARDWHPDAILISSQNGHAFEDLAPLQGMLHTLGVPEVPIYLGGNLSVGADKQLADVTQHFLTIGLRVVDTMETVLRLLPAPEQHPEQKGDEDATDPRGV
jgi:methylaspartate mutase sigma subunit